jgi:hypothetical protein
MEVKPPEGKMTFRLLDQDLHNTTLSDKALDLRNVSETNSDNDEEYNKLSVEDLEANPGLNMTFGDLDGQPLKFPEDNIMRPSKRMLGLHAIFARRAAQDRTPRQRIRDVAYDTSGDERTKQEMEYYSILTKRDDVG